MTRQSQLAIEHTITADLDDGQLLPPFIEDGLVWRVVRRADGRTLWRRLETTLRTPLEARSSLPPIEGMK